MLGDVRAFCNLDTDACAMGQCVADSDCGEGTVCDLSQRKCSNGQCTTDCNGRNCEGLGASCDMTSCVCYVVEGGFDCPEDAGLAVKRDGTACDLATYQAGACVDACDPNQTCVPTELGAQVGPLFGFFTCD